MNIDPSFWNAAWQGIPIIFVIISAVFVVKKFGVTGHWLTASALIFGLGFGGLYLVGSVQNPVWNFQTITGIVFASLAYGFTAALFYEQLGALFFRMVEKYLQGVEEKARIGAPTDGE